MNNGRSLFGFLGVIAAVAAIAFSCEEPPPPPEVKGLSLSWEQGALKVGHEATSASLTVVARLDWTLIVTEGAEWLGSPSVRVGWKGTTETIRFNFAANGGETARTAKITLVAVGEDEPYECVITQTPMGVLSGVNEWIYNEMLGWYYWNDAVKAAAQPDATLAYDRFLLKLVENAYAEGAYDDGDPPTIDGYYSYSQNGTRQRYYYSYIERTATETRSRTSLASESVATTFGFDVYPFIIGGNENDPRIGYLIVWVRPGGPAAEEGLKRGSWIVEYNGAEIRMNQHATFLNQLYFLEGGEQMDVTVFDDLRDTSDPRDLSLAAVEMTASPILHKEVVESPGGKKTAYLFYNRFELGDNTGSDRNPVYEFERELREVFGEFKAAGATELVIDLRYNPGGYVYACQVLTSLAADVDDSKVFSLLKRNPNINDVWEPEYGWRVDNPQKENFLKETNSLGLRKIYVLATEDSASASEFVINSLRGVDIGVVHIGTTTNGKNTGMDHRTATFDGWDYEMKPITFRIYNAKNESNYAGGLTPDVYLDELYELKDNPGATGEIFQLGDPNERLLKAALTLIDGGTVTPDARGRTRAADLRQSRLRRTQEQYRQGSMIYIPRRAQTTER